MRRLLTLLLVVIAGTVVPSSLATAAIGPIPAGRRYVPTPLPAGWFVNRATPPIESAGDGGFSYYGDRSDLAHGRALAVGAIGSEDGFDGLRDAHPKAVGAKGPPDAKLSRNGNFAWVTWPDPDAQDTFRLVAARGLSDDEVLAAARGRIPDGIQQLVRAEIGPDYSAPAQHIDLVDRSGQQHIHLDAFAGSAAVRAMQQFWVQQSALRTHGNGGGGLSVIGPQERVIVVARGDASARELRRLAASMRATDAAGWESFRRRVADLPVSALFPGAANASGVVLDGFTDGVRWGVAFDNGQLAAAYTTIVTADLASMGAGSGVPSGGDLPEVLSGGSVSTNGGSVFAGVIPAGATSARFVPDGRPPVDAVLGPATADGTHRYFAAWVPDVSGTVPLVVYDASGAVLLQRQKFGCNVCDD